MIDISASLTSKPAFSAGEPFSTWQIRYGGAVLPLSANPAVRSADGCKIHKRVPGGNADWLEDEAGGDGTDCLPADDVDDADECRGKPIGSFDGRLAFSVACTAENKHKTFSMYC